MKSQPRGESTSGAEVLTIDLHGLWLFAKGKEYFLPYSEFPWFKEAQVGRFCGEANTQILVIRHE